MFGRKKKIEELEKRLADVERECAYQAEKIKLLQEQCERIERRSVAQAKDFDEKIINMSKHISRLNCILTELTTKPEEQSLSGEKESEAVTVAQVMDEWLNGKKEGGK